MTGDKDETSGAKGWLEDAYDLSTPDDNRAYYRAFSKVYDAEFAQALGYCYPQIIADAFGAASGPLNRPIADIGCGTGLVAAALPPGLAVDGFDISAQMLEQAADKGLYRSLYEADITGDLGAFQGHYGAILSAGTFTHGHLGPEPLSNLLKIGRRDALFVIGVNKAHFEATDFEAVLAGLVSTGRISPPKISQTQIYNKSGHAHADDLALVVTFQNVAETVA